MSVYGLEETWFGAKKRKAQATVHAFENEAALEDWIGRCAGKRKKTVQEPDPLNRARTKVEGGKAQARALATGDHGIVYHRTWKGGGK